MDRCDIFVLLTGTLFGVPVVAWLVIAAALTCLALAVMRRRSGTREISVIAILVAASLASNYALIWLPNVKLMDLIVFVSGLQFGMYVGCMVGVLVWAVYGSINPYGFILPIWVGCMLSESLFGVAGGLIGKHTTITPGSPRVFAWEMAVTGFILSFIYDVMTNLLSAVTISWFETTYLTVLAVMVSGIPFALVHEISNGILFFLGVGPLSLSIQRTVGVRPHVSR